MLSFIDYLLLGGGNTEWNPLDKSAQVTLSNANLRAAIVLGPAGVRATQPRASSGKFYFEVLIQSTSGGNTRNIGLVNSSHLLTDDMQAAGLTAVGCGASDSVARIFHGPGPGLADFASTPSSNDYVGLAVDLGNSKIYMHKNGTYAGTGNPSAGTGGVSFSISGALYPYVGHTTNATTFDANFSGPFQYSIPTGHSPWG